MPKRFVLALVLFGAALFAETASACQKCCLPPPYTRYACCSTICGMTNCDFTASGAGSLCYPHGDSCASNVEYCREENGGFYEQWVECRPQQPLSKRWQLVAVKVTQPTAKTKRG